jgi:hypothetical protein
MGVVIAITGTAQVLDDDTRESLHDPKPLARVAKLRHTTEFISKSLNGELAAPGLKGGDICLTLGSSGTGVLVQSTLVVRHGSPETWRHAWNADCAAACRM